MKILITGGAGYVGVLLAEALLKQDHQVTILDNFMYGYDFVLHLLSYKNLQVVKCDIRNNIEEYLKDKDVIYHLAGISGYPACEANPSSAQFINVDATRSLVNTLSREQLLVYASTTSFYGSSGDRCDETSTPDPVSLYGITKWKAEQIIMERENSMAFRFATIFGVSPKMRPDLLVNDFTHKAVAERCIVLFEGRTRRTFLHIKDAVAAYLMLLDNIDEMNNNVYNVGSDTMNYSKLEIADAIKKETGCGVIDSSISDLDLRNFRICFDKITKLGFKPTVTLEQGVKELVNLYSFYRPYSNFRTI